MRLTLAAFPLALAAAVGAPAAASGQPTANASVAVLGQPDSAGFAIARRVAVALGTFAGTPPAQVIPFEELEALTRQGYYSSPADVTAAELRAIAVRARASVFVGLIRVQDSLDVMIATPTSAPERRLGRWPLRETPVVSVVFAIVYDSGFIRVRGSR